MPNFQVGAEHYLYLAYSDGSTPLTVDTFVDTAGVDSPAGTSINDIEGDLELADLIKDVTVGGANNTVDITTRQTARAGYSASIIATSDATMQVQFAYEPRDESAKTWTAINRDDLSILYHCFITKSSIFAIDLDGSKATDGAGGLGANWTIGFSQPKEVQGQVVLDVEFALESYAQLVYWDTTVFKAFVNPPS